jgi:Carboxypeptidase regulatory-like domain
MSKQTIAPTIAFLLALTTDSFAQATTGRIAGTVKDQSGAVLPGVTVTATETRTGFARTEVTDGQGAYGFVNLPLGDYAVGAELIGFQKAVRSGYVLDADARLTVDFSLGVGAFNEAVQVTVQRETVNLTSGELAHTVDRAQVQDLALNGRNYMQLATLIPGSPLLNDDALNIMTGLGINTSINGSRQNSNLLTVDGGFNMDSGSNNSQISNVGIDFIEEVSIKTSNFSAEYGRNSGAAINVVTRSGGNAFKGSMYEYLRNDTLDANDWFANAKNVAKAPLHYNNYGGTFGGPIAKDRLFFFGGTEWKKIRRFTNPTFRTLPTHAMRAGDFSALSARLAGFAGNIVPASLITPDGAAIAKVYDAMEQLASFYSDTATANNALFQNPNPFDFRQEMIRVDYQPSGAQRLTTRVVFDHYDLLDPGGTFINSQLPTVPTNRVRPGRNVQLDHYWTLGSRMSNEIKINYSGNSQQVPPVGDAWKRSTYGFQFPQLYPGGGAYADSIPNVDVTGYATFRGASGSLYSPTRDVSAGDTLTWIKGAHTIKSGGVLIRNGKDQNGRSEYAGFVSFQSNGNPNSTGNGFADALVGNFRTYREAQLDPIGRFRFWQFEGFVTDAWRLSDRVSVEAGLRYAWQEPTLTLGNNTTSFDPSRYDPARAVTVLPNGTIVAGSGDRFNGLTRPGSVPADQRGDVPNADDPFVQAIPLASSAGYYQSQSLFAPRFSLAWRPGESDRTSIRGGVGLFYDRPEGNLYYPLPNNPPFALSSTYQNGNLRNPAGGAVAPLAPWASMDALDPNLKIPSVWNWSASVQRQLPWWDLFSEIAYVGNRGQHLIRQPDINQPDFIDLVRNAAGPKNSTDSLRPYKGFSSINMRISDGDSSYHALQVSLSRRRRSANFTLDYTLARAWDNASSNTFAPEDYLNKDYSWGPSNDDRTHIFVGTFTAQTFAGVSVSGIVRAQSGPPLTVTGNTSIGNRRADAVGDDVYIPDAQRTDAAGNVQWLNPTTFVAAPEGRRGDTGRNAYRGPGYYVWDMSLRKQVKIGGGASVQIQADFFNVFNQVNFHSPNANLSSAGFGLITAAAPPRQVQLGARVSF